jgi:hypothetical protein
MKKEKKLKEYKKPHLNCNMESHLKIRSYFFVFFVLIFSSCSDQGKIKELAPPANDSVNSKTAVEHSKSEKLVGELYIEIPEDLKEIDEDKVKIKYPGANRPDYVYGTEDMGVNLCYSIKKVELKLSDLESYLKSTGAAIASRVGQSNVAQIEMDTVNSIPFAIIEFYSPTQTEGRIYNLMFTTSLNNRLTMISFNCLESRMKEWEEELPEIFSSIKLKK